MLIIRMFALVIDISMNSERVNRLKTFVRVFKTLEYIYIEHA